MTDSGGKDKAKTETRSEAKDTSGGDAGDGASGDADGAKSDASASYSRGENQKAVTDAYRSNWHDVFGKKKRRGAKK